MVKGTVVLSTLDFHCNCRIFVALVYNDGDDVTLTVLQHALFHLNRSTHAYFCIRAM